VPKVHEEIDNELELRQPQLYRVILHNDDYTTMEFVIDVLKKIFKKSTDEAEEIMWKVHEKGQAVCGVYTYEIAETKVEQVKVLARQNGFPLLATFEADE
jgi:ATP-dependent Clp protease adaptor protein ClpS